MASASISIEDRTGWAAAGEVQRRFMQSAAPADATFDFGARCRQLDELGGDFYDCFPLDGGRFAMAVGDASGKGLAAALMTSNVQSSVRTAAFYNGKLAETVETVNRHVHATSLANRYATLFYAVLDGSSMRYVNAGHNPPIIVRGDGSVERLEAGGPPVGMFAEWRYEEGAVRLYPGDVVVVYTDGVTEVESARGEFWCLESLAKAAIEKRARTASEWVDAVFQSMDEFAPGCQSDDATVTVLRITRPPLPLKSPQPRCFGADPEAGRAGVRGIPGCCMKSTPGPARLPKPRALAGDRLRRWAQRA